MGQTVFSFCIGATSANTHDCKVTQTDSETSPVEKPCMGTPVFVNEFLSVAVPSDPVGSGMLPGRYENDKVLTLNTFYICAKKCLISIVQLPAFCGEPYIERFNVNTEGKRMCYSFFVFTLLLFASLWLA